MYFNQKITEIEAELKTSSAGLKTAQIEANQRQFGRNILPRPHPPTIFMLFLREFIDPLVALLLVAIIVSLVVGEFIDALVIAVIVLVDAIISTVQEYRASRIATSLEKLVPATITIVRDGKKREISVDDLTVGDYALLESGDKISADMRVVKAQNFMVDESILTGESLQVAKNSAPLKKTKANLGEQSNMLFAGTIAVSGRAEAIVTAVGSATELGKIADSLSQTADEKSPLTIRIEKLSRQISLLVLVIAAIITTLLIVKGYSYDQIILTVIAFAVSAMPEGLPLALTMALTIASNRMAKRNVVVRRLHAAESLGSCTVIASDKTGTLTVNQQTAKLILLPNGDRCEISGTGYQLDGKITGRSLDTAKQLAFFGAINNEANLDNLSGDSIDLAFLVLAHKFRLNLQSYQLLTTIPYESENKYSAVFYRQGDKNYCTVKGSPEVVLSFCGRHGKKLSNQDKVHFLEQNASLAKDGYRVIALAQAEIPSKAKYSASDLKDLQFAGMVGFIDPIRPEAAASIRDCVSAGIKVLMVTGDHPLTANKIAHDLKLVSDNQQVITGDELDNIYEQDPALFDQTVAEKRVFARVTPLQKLRVVESLKKSGEFVAVTGDGVNDAPALKSANIGVAMGSGTDITHDVADMIVVDDNFKSIVAGIEEGRIAYANIRKIILFLISCGLAEATFFFLAIALNLPMPFVAVQLLWLNVVTDGIQDLALSFERGESDILKQAPRSPHESIFDRRLFRQILFSGATISLIIFLVWYVMNRFLHLELIAARSYLLCLMVFIQNIHVFNCRSEHKSAFSNHLRDNRMIVFGVIGSLALQLAVMVVPQFASLLQLAPISLRRSLGLLGLALLILVIIELRKQIENHYHKLKQE